jgi:hypothetical protein
VKGGCSVREIAALVILNRQRSALLLNSFIYLRRFKMNVIAVEPLLALVMGILILLVPRFLNYFVAVYLIVVGILGLMHHGIT